MELDINNVQINNADKYIKDVNHNPIAKVNYFKDDHHHTTCRNLKTGLVFYLPNIKITVKTRMIEKNLYTKVPVILTYCAVQYDDFYLYTASKNVLHHFSYCTVNLVEIVYQNNVVNIISNVVITV